MENEQELHPRDEEQPNPEPENHDPALLERAEPDNAWYDLPEVQFLINRLDALQERSANDLLMEAFEKLSRKTKVITVVAMLNYVFWVKIIAVILFAKALGLYPLHDFSSLVIPALVSVCIYLVKKTPDANATIKMHNILFAVLFRIYIWKSILDIELNTKHSAKVEAYLWLLSCSIWGFLVGFLEKKTPLRVACTFAFFTYTYIAFWRAREALRDGLKGDATLSSGPEWGAYLTLVPILSALSDPS